MANAGRYGDTGYTIRISRLCAAALQQDFLLTRAFRPGPWTCISYPGFSQSRPWPGASNL